MIGRGYLRCTAGDREFAIPAADVCHVARADQLRPDPGGDHRLGTLTLGGQSVPVYSLRSTLELPETTATVAHADCHIAVTGGLDAPVGWLVDHLARESPAANIAFRRLPACVGPRASHWFDGIVVIEDREPLLVISPAALSPLHQGAPGGAPREASSDEGPAPRLSAVVDPVALLFSTPALPATGDCRFALSARHVAAIVHPAPALPVPGSAPHVAGITMWRDAVVPIFDFRSAAARRDDPRGRRLVARCSATHACTYLAFAIEPDVLMHRPGTDDRRVTGAACPPFASAIFDIDGNAVALLDLDALVAA